MSILSIGGLTKYYGAEFIFGNVSFQIARGDKVALVGVNGAGKSTLLKIIAGIESASGGGVYMARGTRLAYLAQEARFSGDKTLWEEMLASLGYLTELRDQLSALEHELADTSAPDWEARMERYGELSHRFEHAGGYEIEHRIERTLHGLGFSEAQFQQRVAQFSGGQKTRAALAATLLSDPDVLLLDEPTNHLDLAALEWLERFLNTWDGTLIVISHDRYFLDKVTTRTLDMAFGRVEDYPGGYNKYLQLKAERLELQLKQFQAQQDYIAKTEEFIRRFKAGQRSKEARGREKILNRLKNGYQGAGGVWVNERIDSPQHQKKLALSMATEVRSGELVLSLERLTVGYTQTQEDGGQAHVLLQPPELEIHRGQRVALMGPNGSGKSTLLRTIVGELEPLRGRARLGHKVLINYYAQAHEGLRLQATVLDELWRIRPQMKEGELRTLLGRFLFSGDDVFKRVGDLSGGERSRVALAQLMLMGGNLLVLDEPTNHLDIDAREALETVLNEYNGTILFVSHDRYFIDAVADVIWMVRDGSIAAFDGTYSEFAAAQERAAAAAAPAPARPATKAPAAAQSPAGGTAPDTGGPAGSRQNDKEERKRQRRLAALEKEIAELERDLKRIESEIGSASTGGQVARVTDLSRQYAQVQETLQTRYDEWAGVAG
jgi:ATP-binding cassette subfamily F protein 3